MVKKVYGEKASTCVHLTIDSSYRFNPSKVCGAVPSACYTCYQTSKLPMEDVCTTQNCGKGLLGCVGGGKGHLFRGFIRVVVFENARWSLAFLYRRS